MLLKRLCKYLIPNYPISGPSPKIRHLHGNTISRGFNHSPSICQLQKVFRRKCPNISAGGCATTEVLGSRIFLLFPVVISCEGTRWHLLWMPCHGYYINQAQSGNCLLVIIKGLLFKTGALLELRFQIDQIC